MAANVTLLTMRTEARQRADQENSSFISDAELNGYLNKSARKLWDMLIDADASYKFSSATLTTTGLSDTLPLPTDFYKLLLLDYTSSGQRRPLDKIDFFERTYGTTPVAGIQLNLEYAPPFTDLVNDADTFDGINGWEEFVEIDAAIKCLNKEETDPGTLLLEKAEIVARIEKMRRRDFANPERTRDVRKPYSYFYPTDNLKYRLIGNSIQVLSVGRENIL